jgi:hypothetical protein
MSVNASKLASVYFSESSLFNGLRALQVRKSLPRPGSRDRLWANGSNSHKLLIFRPAFGEGGKRFREQQHIANISDFVKEIHGARCSAWQAIRAAKILIQLNFASNSEEFRAPEHGFSI